MKHRTLFITGTDTGIGKTIVTALLLARLRQTGINAVAMKPISSGSRSDARLLRALAISKVSLDQINLIHFRHPLAPLVASRLERKPWRLAQIRSSLAVLNSAFRPVLVEGIGGLLVPLRTNCSVRDLVKNLRLPLLIVARPGLGTLNHTALTVEAARAAGIKVLGVILNGASGDPRGLAERTNSAAIEEVCGVKVLAEFPHLSRLRPTRVSVLAALRRLDVRRACDKLIAAL
jgi:dethiobiotin synthetase